MTKKIIISSIIFVLTLLPWIVCAQVPQMMNYQGYLVDSAGNPVNGDVTIIFSIYDSEDLSVWQESHDGVECDKVTVQNGKYAVRLGECNQPIDLAEAQQYYLGVQIESQAEKREPVSSAMYALFADKLEGITVKDGNVGIGKTASTARLEVTSNEAGAIISQTSSLGGASNWFEPNYPTLSVLRGSSTRGATIAMGNSTGKFYLYGSAGQLAFVNSNGDFMQSITQDGTIFKKNIGFFGTNPTAEVASDGFRIRYDSNFFGTNKDAMIFEKTDGNNGSPDGGIAFVNTGEDGVAEPAFVIRGSGKVGIGTTFPNTKLHVMGGIDASFTDDGYVVIGDKTSTNLVIDDNEIIARNNSGESTLHLQALGGDILVHTGKETATKFVIKDDGNVGIGITVPKAKLHVAGETILSGNIGFFGTNPIAEVASDGFRIRYDHNFFDTNKDAMIFEKTDGNDGSPDGGLVFMNTGEDGVAEPSLVIKGNNAVGIGTTTPERRLDVNGNFRAKNMFDLDTANTSLRIYEDEDTSEWIRFRPYSGKGFVFSGNNDHTDLVIDAESGKIGIGTASPTEKLSVNGTILARKVVVSVESEDWPDYVFDEAYQLQPLTEVEGYIKQHKHLPDFPSAQEVSENGVDVVGVQAKQLQLSEEIMLRLIEMEKKITALQQENAQLKEQLSVLQHTQ